MKKYYYKKENGTYTWISPEMKLVFSKMSFQAHDEYGYVKNINEIMYLYYTVEVFAKKHFYDDNGRRHYRWNPIASKNASDFPTITELQYILEQYLEDKIPLEDCRLIHYYHRGEMLKNRVGYVHSMDTDGFFYDDAYNLKRIIVKENDREIQRYYSLYVGCSIDPQGGGASIGMRMDISEAGLRCLYQCIIEFLEEGIKRSNEAVRRHLSKEEYSVDDNNRLIRMEDEKITELFMEGEKIDGIIFYKGDLNSDSFYSESYNDVTLSKFTKDEITFTGGYSDHKNEEYNKLEPKDRIITAPLKNIVYMCTNIEEPTLSMNEEDIANDLKKVLTKEELEEIKNSSISEMNQKWYGMIVDRYIIFRDEHHFKQLKKDERENKTEAVNTILKLLKNL